MKTLLLMILLSLSLNSKARTLIISDIDDTLRKTHVLSSEMFLNVFDFDNPFKAMNSLLNHIQFAEQDALIFYVSGAPDDFGAYWIQERFLNENKFPNGQIYVRNSLAIDTYEFKVRKIIEILDLYKPDKVILIGDNGEKDIFVYKTITKKYASFTKIASFIRIAYHSQSGGMPLLEDQVGFVTPAEIAMYLKQKSIVNLLDLQIKDLIKLSLSASLSIGKVHIDLVQNKKILNQPTWVDCREHSWDFSDFFLNFPETIKLDQQLKKRCSLVGDD